MSLLREELATVTLAVVLEFKLEVKGFEVLVVEALALALASSCSYFSFLHSNFLCPQFLQWEHLSVDFFSFSCFLALA